ncbi:MAG TPA: DUF433 domain-containing protein [Planktothrix sp.]|jgi:hypothetical protein
MDIVVCHELRGYGIDEIVAMFPGISPADVHAALTYYFDNREEIDSDFQKDEEASKENLPKHPSKFGKELSA